tara:strand:- start:213 stop:1148 length:936 start_codon:yes stop_codon:yes gene_type:complete
MIFNGTTIAFSTKANVWKTRYSFTPSCYMTMDNDFLSSNTNRDSNDLMWRHDQNPQHNSFYNSQVVNSSLEIVSNQNPSSVKIFKALSLETDARVWNGSVYTNKTRDPFAFQEGYLKSFVQKEGNQYADMPRSSTNSSSNIVFIGVVKVADLIPTSSELISKSWHIPLMNLPDVAVPSNQSSYVYFGEALISPSDDGNVFSASGGYTPATELIKPLLFNRYEGSDNSIVVQTLALNTMGAEATIDMMTTFAEYFMTAEIPVYIMTDPVLDGDNIRGPYAGIKLTSTNSASPFELFAINVDYEKTKLDGSLG